MYRKSIVLALAFALVAAACGSDEVETTDDVEAVTAASSMQVADDVIAAQRAALAAAAIGAGPQAPRDFESGEGTNQISFNRAPAYTEMNLCNIHFHEAAEHKGGEYTTYAGNGDGEGYGTGYLYDGELTEAELAPYSAEVGKNSHGELVPGDTIEIHYVHSTDAITPGPTLGSCLASDTSTPDLQVQSQVYVLVNDDSAADLTVLAEVAKVGDLYQAVNLPTDLGTVVQYAGSTTGPSYNEKPSPFQVTWSVYPEVLKVNIASVEAWFAANEFDENYAHAVRNLVTNPDLLSPIAY